MKLELQEQKANAHGVVQYLLDFLRGKKFNVNVVT